MQGVWHALHSSDLYLHSIEYSLSSEGRDSRKGFLYKMQMDARSAIGPCSNSRQLKPTFRKHFQRRYGYAICRKEKFTEFPAFVNFMHRWLVYSPTAHANFIHIHITYKKPLKILFVLMSQILILIFTVIIFTVHDVMNVIYHAFAFVCI